MKKRRFSFIKFLLIAIAVIVVISFISSMFMRPQTVGPNATPIDNTTDDGKTSYEGFNADALSTSYSSTWKLTSNVGTLNSAVVAGVRPKRTQIIGNKQDKVLIMVYMCGSDLESQSAMGVYDLVEMANADFSDNVNLVVYTGGTTKWHTDAISNRYNQIYKVMGDGKIQPLVENAGTGAMIDPDTLTSFIEYATSNFEANRYELIFWDHGGGTVSGYGYDEKYPRSGSMSLSQIDKALTNAGIEFDFIGFDCCLMATTETALMLSEHADYMIGSEESEPGIGWYYTNWLSKLSNNPSMPTLEIGKNIADDFVSKCRQDTPSQIATLSVIDLAEIEDIIPNKLSAFASDTKELISTDYRNVASARSGAREFAQESYIDMVDFIGLASNMQTQEGNELAQALMSAVKYNNTNVSNAYGLSVYFPYRSTKYLGTVLNVYNEVDMNEEYADCIRSFASYQGGGQVSSGGSHQAYQSFNNSDYTQYYNSQSSSEALFNILELFMGGGYGTDSGYSSYYSSGMDSWFDRSMTKEISDYVSKNHFDGALNWKDDKITLSDEQWEMVTSLKLNVFIDDGSGYIDLGKDALYEFDDKNALLKPEELTWMVASADNDNWQFVPFYYMYKTTDGDKTVYTGRIPVLLNGKLANLMVEIDDDLKVIGANYDYRDEADMVSKNLYEIKEGDEIEFVCDYYDYNGNYDDSYILGDKLIVKDEIYLGDMSLAEENALASYEFKDIYQQAYYSEAIR